MDQQDYANRYYELAKRGDTLASSVIESKDMEILTIADDTNPQIVIYIREKDTKRWRKLSETSIYQES